MVILLFADGLWYTRLLSYSYSYICPIKYGKDTKRTIYTVLRSPFIDKKSREQFQTKVHKRVVDIVNSTPKTVESLMKLDLPSGVDIEIRG